MEDYIFDGELHALNKEFAYISKKLDMHFKKFDLKGEVYEMYKKYSIYLMECDKEKAVECIMKAFQMNTDWGKYPEDTRIIYKPAHMVSCLAQFGTLILMFKRSRQDNLDENEKNGCDH